MEESGGNEVGGDEDVLKMEPAPGTGPIVSRSGGPIGGWGGALEENAKPAAAVSVATAVASEIFITSVKIKTAITTMAKKKTRMANRASFQLRANPSFSSSFLRVVLVGTGAESGMGAEKGTGG